jgi:hypothetical protein
MREGGGCHVVLAWFRRLRVVLVAAGPLLLWAGCVVVGPVVGDVVPPWCRCHCRCGSPPVVVPLSPHGCWVVVSLAASVDPRRPIAPPIHPASSRSQRWKWVLGFSSSGPLSCCHSRPRHPPSWSSCLRCRLHVPVVTMTGPLAPAILPASSGSQGRGTAGAGAGLLALVVLVVVAVAVVAAAAAALVLSFPPSLSRLAVAVVLAVPLLVHRRSCR